MVYKGVFFEVVAEDGSIASYSLLPSASASDAYLTSNMFRVNEQDKIIKAQHGAGASLCFSI